jgi:hypothetical protein
MLGNFVVFSFCLNEKTEIVLFYLDSRSIAAKLIDTKC